MAPTYPVEQSLRSLQTLFNGVLQETGKAFRAADKNNGRDISLVPNRLRGSLPSIETQWHNALDDLEFEILKVKSILGRDLALLREERMAKEAPVPVIPLSTGAAGPATSGVVDTPTITNNFANGHTMSAPEATAGKQMGRPTQGPQKHAGDFNESVAKRQKIQDSPLKRPGVLKSPEVQRKGSSAQAPQAPQINAGPPPTAAKPENGAATQQAAPAGHAMQLDSEFGTNGGANNSTLNFEDIDFSAGNQDTHMDLSFPNNQNAPNGNNNNDDVSSLLPGLESYANSGGDEDFTMTDIPHETITTNINANANNAAGPADDDDPFELRIGNGAAEEANQDSTFDDMWDGLDFGPAGEEETGGGGSMEHGEFDNAFFGLEDGA